MSEWSIDRARRTYAVPHWGEGYFDIDAEGGIEVLPRGGEGPRISLPAVVDQALATGMKLPLLLRFSDVLGHRLGRLQAAFAHAMRELDYSGGYTAIYPIKVNQHYGVAGELAAHGGEGFGLEAGSKPELMAVLALSRPGRPQSIGGNKRYSTGSRWRETSRLYSMKIVTTLAGTIITSASSQRGSVP
jgi:arginine decarboxylase